LNSISCILFHCSHLHPTNSNFLNPNDNMSHDAKSRLHQLPQLDRVHLHRPHPLPVLLLLLLLLPQAQI
jgi:hypothetical protein